MTAPIAITRTPLDRKVLDALAVMTAAGQIIEVRVIRSGLPAIYEIRTEYGFARAAAALVEAARFDGVKVQAFDTGDPALPDSITRPIYIRG